jgi:hypothetical protein
MSNFLFKQYTLVDWQAGAYTGVFFPSALARTMSCDVLISGHTTSPIIRFFYSNPFDPTGRLELMNRTITAAAGLNYTHFNLTGLPIGQISAGIETSGVNARTSISVFQQN